MKIQKNLLQSRGFTIVELLIVIVVIGILAAITVVAYNGIQKRAQTAQYAAAADGAEKSFSGLAITNYAGLVDAISTYSGGLYEGDSTYSGYFCLAYSADLPATADFEAGECYRQSDESGSAVMSARANDALLDGLAAAGLTGYKFGALTPAKMPSPFNVMGRAIIAMVATGNGRSIMMFAWVAPDHSSCGREDEYSVSVSDVLDDIQKVLSGEMTAEEAGFNGYTQEQLQQMYSQLKDGGNQCIVSISQ